MVGCSASSPRASSAHLLDGARRDHGVEARIDAAIKLGAVGT